MAFNPWQFGSPSPRPMVMRARIFFNDETQQWVVQEQIMGATIIMSDPDKDKAINKLKEWKNGNKYQNLDPDY